MLLVLFPISHIAISSALILFHFVIGTATIRLIAFAHGKPWRFSLLPLVHLLRKNTIRGVKCNKNGHISWFANFTTAIIYHEAYNEILVWVMY